MRTWHIAALALTLVSASAFAQSPPAYPPGAEAREAQLMARIGPQTRGWIAQEARRQASLPEPSEQGVIGDIRGSVAVLGNLNGADIEALCFIVLMEASKSSQDDLKAIMDGVKSVNGAKAQQRQNQQRLRAVANGAKDPSPAQRPLGRPNLQVARAAIQPRPVPKAELDAKIAAAKNDLDSMNELGEMESLRLQMAMDRMSKMMSTLSNILKKISDTAQSITQNLK